MEVSMSELDRLVGKYPCMLCTENFLTKDAFDEHFSACVRDISATIIMESFLQKYGRYNYVSKSENKKLIKYQKSNTFLCPSESYKKARVRLVDYEDCKKK